MRDLLGGGLRPKIAREAALDSITLLPAAIWINGKAQIRRQKTARPVSLLPS
jgi:hypothetical protein